MNTPNALTTMETATLAACEDVIHRGLSVFYEVGNALAAIRDSRLYRAEYGTFEDYCRERWGMVASRARQLIGAAKVVKNLQSVTDVTVLPTSEAQCRPLVKLEPQEQVTAWRESSKPTSVGMMSAEYLDRTADRLESKPWPIRRRILAAKHLILTGALRQLALDFDDIPEVVLRDVDEAVLEAVAFEVLESTLLDRMAGKVAKA